jgi:hypothetical protein
VSSDTFAKVMCLSMSLILHGTVCLGCLFIYKMYIVMCRPEKNNKERVMRNTPSRSRNSFTGSIHGSHAGEKRRSFGMTLEDRTSASCSRKPSSACGRSFRCFCYSPLLFVEYQYLSNLHFLCHNPIFTLGIIYVLIVNLIEKKYCKDKRIFGWKFLLLFNESCEDNLIL